MATEKLLFSIKKKEYQRSVDMLYNFQCIVNDVSKIKKKLFV